MWTKSKLKIKVEPIPVIPDAAYVTLEGAGDATNVMDLVEVLQPLFQKGVCRFAFDFEKLKYFNETFEGFLTKQAERLNSGAGILVVVGLHPKLLVLFQLLSFDRIYRLANSREEAIEQLRTLSGQKINP